MEVILRYLLLYFVIVFGSIFITYVFKKKTSQTLPTSLLSIMFILYIFGLFNHLILGVWLVCIVSILLGISVILLSIIKKEIKDLIKNSITGGFIAFTVIYLIFGFTTYSKMFTVWDEYTYWSVASKFMYYSDSFVTNPDSLMHIVYPPCPTILQYFFGKVINVYSQGIELFASQLLGFTLLLPLFKNIKEKRKLVVFITGCILLCIPSVFIESLFYYTIYVDTLIGLLVGYIFYEYYTSTSKDKFTILTLILGLIALTFTKTIGVFIAIVIICTLGIDYIINIILKEKKQKIKEYITAFLKGKEFRLLLVFLAIVIIIFISWQVHIRNTDQRELIGSTFETKYEGSVLKYLIKTFGNSFLGIRENTFSELSTMNLYYDVFDRDYYSSKPFNMSAGTWMCIFGIFSLFIYKYLVQEEKEKKRFISCIISMFIGLIAYILVLQVAYLVEFSIKEAIAHNSIQRYVGSFLVAMLYVIIGKGLYYLNQKESYKKSSYVLILAIVLMFTPIAPIANSTISAGAYNNTKIESLKWDMEKVENVKSKVKEQDKIYLVHQTSNKDTHLLRFKYFILPMKIEITDMFSETRIDNRLLGVSDIDEWEKLLLEEYDYVYVLNTNEYFDENYNELFENNEVISWTLYKIKKEKENVLLVPIE